MSRKIKLMDNACECHFKRMARAEMIEKFCNNVARCGCYIEWSYEGQNLVSCQLQGESEHIERLADECPFKELFEKYKNGEI